MSVHLRFCRAPLKSIFSHAKKVLLVINEDNMLCLYRLEGLKPIWSVSLGNSSISKMILSPDANFVGLLAESTVEVRSIEDGTISTSIHWSPCTSIKWVPSCNRSSVLCLWNDLGQLKLLLDAQTEIFSGFVAEEIADVCFPENLTHITLLLKQGSLWSITAFSTGIVGSRLPAILAKEEQNKKRRQHSESWKQLFSSLATLHAEHAKLIDDLQKSNSTHNLEQIIQQAILLEDRNCLAGFRKLYDIRKIYRIRDKLVGLLDEARRKYLAVQEDKERPSHLDPILNSVKIFVLELEEVQKTFVSWICAICGSANSALPPVKLSQLIEAYSFLRKDTTKELEAYYHQLTDLKPESKISLNITLSHSKSIQFPPEIDLVIMHAHKSNEVILISWNAFSSCLQSHSILFDDEITTTTVLNTQIEGITRPDEIHFCNPQGTLVALLYGCELLIYVAKTLKPVDRIPWENQIFDQWKGVALAQYTLSCK